MSRKELESLKVKELVEICKEKGIKHYKGKNRFTKQEMIEAILNNNVADDKDCNTVKNKTIEQLPGTKDYLDRIAVGALVAFKEEDGKLNTAKVTAIAKKNKKLKLITSYGEEFVIMYKDIMWVRTTYRWPRHIYEELKKNRKKKQERK